MLSLVFFGLPGPIYGDEATDRESNLKALRSLVESGAVGSIDARFPQKGPDLIPALRTVLEEVRHDEARYLTFKMLRRELAALGDTDARLEIIEELGSSDLQVREFAFLEARRLPGPDMIVAVAERLFDPAPGGRLPGSLHEVVGPTRSMAVLTLAHLVDDATAPLKDRIIGTDEEVEAWKAWWLENKHRYVIGPG